MVEQDKGMRKQDIAAHYDKFLRPNMEVADLDIFSVEALNQIGLLGSTRTSDWISKAGDFIRGANARVAAARASFGQSTNDGDFYYTFYEADMVLAMLQINAENFLKLCGLCPEDLAKTMELIPDKWWTDMIGRGIIQFPALQDLCLAFPPGSPSAIAVQESTNRRLIQSQISPSSLPHAQYSGKAYPILWYP